MKTPAILRNGVKYYTPHEGLVGLVKQELHKKKAVKAGKELIQDKESQRKKANVDRRKVHYLDKHIFQAMADLTFLFEAVAKYPELEKLYEDDVKDLLGVRREKSREKSQEYGFMLSRLLRSILIIVDEESKGEESEVRIRDKDFRLKLNQVLQGIVFDKVRPYLIDVFKLQEARIVVKDDFRRAWAWTGTLASNIDEKEEVPHRTFDFETNALLK